MERDDGDETAALWAAYSKAVDYLGLLNGSAVAASLDAATLRARFRRPLPPRGLPTKQVIDELTCDAAGGLVGSAGGRFFGWVIGGTLPAALAADWLVSAWDQNAALNACSPAAAAVEEVTGEWLKELLALPLNSSFAFVTGCQMAHVVCLAAARQDLLLKQNHDVASKGMGGAPKIRILANENCHASITRAANLLGFGTANIGRIATDQHGSVKISAVQQELNEQQDFATILVLQAGDIATGSYDDFTAVIPLAKAMGAWVHIDGAFGLWAAASDLYRHLLRGVEAADSWATDGHKILNTPFDSGYAFVAHPDAHKAVFSLRASYLTHSNDERDQIDWNPDWSRRARGFPTYAAIRALGRDGVADLFEGYCRHTTALVNGLRSIPGVEIVSEPIVNQALVRFPDPSLGSGEKEHATRTDNVIAAINATGEAFFTGATWRGCRVMRISVCNWRTNEGDIERACAAVSTALRSVESGIRQE
jgi:glutamate/tyrosine decarboxylase-like PLP-dependent enzyme